MAHYTVLDAAQLAAALAHFGLPAPTRAEPEPRGEANTGYHLWAGGQRWFLRVNEAKAEADVRFEAEVQLFLHAARFPVPALHPAADGRPFAEVAGKPAMLFAYAAGEALAPAAVSSDHCRRLGEQLGRLHELAAGFGPGRPNPFGPAWVEARLEEAAAAAGPAREAELEEGLELLRDEAVEAAALPGAPRGLVHGDLFVDNVLWIGDRVGALLDWEMSCVDPFAYDLGVALNAWCYTDRWLPERARALLAGYRARRKVEPETLAGLYRWSRFAALRFAVGRLHGYAPGHAARKDWRRFRDRLRALREAGEAGFRELWGG
jgi:homoserine kinase type II